jgi:hypothetical protein
MTLSCCLKLCACAMVFAATLTHAETEWGPPNKEGLTTRVVPLLENPQVGKQLIFRLEGKNTGKETVYADIQNLAHAESTLEITYGKERKVPVISATLAGCETLQDVLRFPPGRVVVIAGGIDAAEEFELSKAGLYRFRHPGLPGELPMREEGLRIMDSEGLPVTSKAKFTNLPPSGQVTLEVAEGPLPPDLAMITKLRPVVPKGWHLCRHWIAGGVQIGKQNQSASVVIDLVVVDPKAGVAMEEGHRKLGRSKLGEIRMGIKLRPAEGAAQAPRKTTLEDLWPDALRSIRAALGISWEA